MATPESAKHRDLEQRFRDLERAVRDLTSRALQRPKFEVSAGDLTVRGGALIVDGGDFLLLDTDGSTVFRLGPQELGDRGVSIYRENGNVALEVREQLDGFGQRLRILDDSGYEIMSEYQIGPGLRRPLLTLQVHPTAAPAGWGSMGPERTTTSSTFTALFVANTVRQNALVRPYVNVKCSDATTAAEVRVVETISGTQLADLFTGTWTGVVPTGTTAYMEHLPALQAPRLPEERLNLEVQVRRTAGTGTVTVAVPTMVGC